MEEQVTMRRQSICYEFLSSALVARRARRFYSKQLWEFKTAGSSFYFRLDTSSIPGNVRVIRDHTTLGRHYEQEGPHAVEQNLANGTSCNPGCNDFCFLP